MRICLVSTDVLGPVRAGGVGTATYNIAVALAEQKNTVDIMYAGHFSDEQNFEYIVWKQIFKEKKINFFDLKIPSYKFELGYYYPIISYIVYLNLLKSKYDLILFPEMCGTAYYTLLAKKNNNDFKSTKLIVIFHGPQIWHLEKNGQLPTLNSEIITQFLEKQSCLLADHLIFSTQHALEIAKDIRYHTNQPHTVLMLPLSKPIVLAKKYRPLGKIQEICFFGRLETRKGLKIFLKSIEFLRLPIHAGYLKITLLGHSGFVDGESASEYISKWSAGTLIPINVPAILSNSLAISYLKNHSCLCVLPSIDETMGYTLAECLVNSIPFICSDIAPYKEVIEKFNLQPNLFTFKKNDSLDLIQKIKSYLHKNTFIKTQFNFKHQNISWHKELLKIKKLNQADNSRKQKKIHRLSDLTICIVHHNRPNYLAQLLKSISPLKKDLHKIIIFDNASTLKNAKFALKKLSRDHKIKVIFSSINHGPSLARNLMSEIVTTPYILYIDDDNMLNAEAFKSVYQNLPDEWDVVTCPLDKFSNSENFQHSIKNTHPISKILFVGNELCINIYNNLAGDANFLVLTEHFKKINGFNPKLSFAEDHNFLIMSLFSSGKYILSPKSFIHYRAHAQQLSNSHIVNTHHSTHLQSIDDNTGNLNIYPFLSLARFYFLKHDQRYNDGERINQLNLRRHNSNKMISNKKMSLLLLYFKNINRYGDLACIDTVLLDNVSNKILAAPISKYFKIQLTLFSENSFPILTNFNEKIEIKVGINTCEVKYIPNNSLVFFSKKNSHRLFIKNIIQLENPRD